MKETIERESTQRERTRIARDLHDSIQQNLTGITHQLNSASQRLSIAPSSAAESLNLAKRMIQRSSEDVRSTIWDLRSETSHQMNFIDAILEMLTPLREMNIDIRFHPSPLSCSLSAVTQHHILYIVKEALHNSVQHALARHIEIRLDADEKYITVTVTDDGIGFDLEAITSSNGHFGIIGMRERAAKINGDIQVRSDANHGTSVSVTVLLRQIADVGEAHE